VSGALSLQNAQKKSREAGGSWEARSIRASGGGSPGEGARRLVQPAVARRHLLHAREAKTDETGKQHEQGVDHIKLERNEARVEERKVNEANRDTERQRRNDEMPARPPGLRDRLSGREARRPAHDERHENEDPDGRVVV